MEEITSQWELNSPLPVLPTYTHKAELPSHWNQFAFSSCDIEEDTSGAISQNQSEIMMNQTTVWPKLINYACFRVFPYTNWGLMSEPPQNEQKCLISSSFPV
jgi:hypothetical protein